MSSYPLTLHCGAERAIESFNLKDAERLQIKECILKYTKPLNASFGQDVHYCAFRLWNLLKSFVGCSEWQKSIRVLIPSSTPTLSCKYLMSFVVMGSLLKLCLVLHKQRCELSSKVPLLIQTVTAQQEIHEDISFSQEDLRKTVPRCPHFSRYSYFS